MDTQANNTRWWSTLDEDDPITLEPLSSLPHPPFLLHTSHFDPLSLSSYVISRNKFQNPLTRTNMNVEDCKRLDESLKGLKGEGYERSRVSVLEAFKLFSRIKVDAPDAGTDRLDAMRSVAGIALQNIFSYNVWRGGAEQEVEGLRIIDDDEVIGEASDHFFRGNNVMGLGDEGVEEVFPELSEEATLKGEEYEAGIEGVKGVVERAAEEKEREVRMFNVLLTFRRFRASFTNVPVASLPLYSRRT
ncbi:hypothetical protein TrLO_g11761 [Triparma laevis f. longispina]|uniref:Uncharacterized protein n=1 Tax=Triparma laevis f. longispina TaxID=1714387 RepID=A0A9W7F1D5_9STRA|nr:hypothetical protein TrLO_g11761 [Triparma laevis f. longispina]